MLGLVLIAVALLGSLVCGVIDLKTTEIPDEIPTGMALLGVIIWSVVSINTGELMPVIMSAAVGTAYLGLGWAFYLTKQWGGGDAKLLAAVGYLLPVWLTNTSSILPFSLVYLFNMFVVGLFYMVVYIVLLGLVRKNVRKIFRKDFRRNGWKVLLILAAFTTAGYFVFPLWFIGLVDLFGIAAFYAKSVEKYFFRTIPVSDLREGDVLAEGKIDGITKDEVKALKRKGGKVKIKDGIRYGFVFFLSLVVTFYYGSLVEIAVQHMVRI